MSDSRKVLIVEDQQPIQMLIKRLVSRPGWEAITADSVASALRIINEHALSLAFIDFMLPDGEGIEISRRLRSSMPHVRINLVTARSEDSIRKLALESGCDRVIIKPFSIQEILVELSLIEARDSGG